MGHYHSPIWIGACVIGPIILAPSPYIRHVYRHFLASFLLTFQICKRRSSEGVWREVKFFRTPIRPTANDDEIQRLGSFVIGDLLRRRRLHWWQMRCLQCCCCNFSFLTILLPPLNSICCLSSFVLQIFIIHHRFDYFCVLRAWIWSLSITVFRVPLTF